MIEILPAILADDVETFRERLTFPGFWKPGMTAHVDILDGSMFGAECFCDPTALKAYTLHPTRSKSFPNIELHCMVRNPVPIVAQWKALVPETVRAIVHAEIDRPLEGLGSEIRQLGLEFGIAFCPETSADLLGTLSALPDRALMMGIQPGASGRLFLGEPILAKIQRLRAQHPSLHISVDGGVNMETAPSILRAGASSLVAASAIWGTPHPAASYKQFIHS